MGERVCRLSMVAVVLAACAAEVAAGFRAAAHPFLLWTRADLAAMRKRIQTQDWAKAALKRWLEHKAPGVPSLGRLVQYAALGDQQAGEAEKAELMRVVRSPVPRGAAQWITALRYDLLYGDLTADERAAFEKMARVYVDNHVFKRAVLDKSVFNNSRNYSRYDARKYTRSNWLPNIIWPWKVSANLLAAAVGDEKLIRRTWAAYGSWKWYFDEYLCDSGFYSEEFSKMGSTPGAMILYCLALERLGLNELGFGYRGRRPPGARPGPTMRGHIESLLHVTYPRVDVCTRRPHYPLVTMGDLRQRGSSQSYNLAACAFQHALVMGCLPGGTGGNERWVRHGAWGGTRRGNSPQWDRDKTPKMQIPLWFELGHSRWPQSGFAYFLAQMRAPDERRYQPSLLFGVEPVDPAEAKPPAAPSGLWPQRGLVMLRADESPAYWESPAPAVAMRLAANYAHHVNDCFALLGYYAHNRPIYLNRQVCPSYAKGWSRSIQSHCGPRVDAREPAFTSATKTRQQFAADVKFVAAESTEVYPPVRLTRSLMLTRRYLLDVTRLADDKPHTYTWFVHALGVRKDEGAGRWKPAEPPKGAEELRDVRRLETKAPTPSVTVVQECALADATKPRMPGEWYARRVGVRLSLLGEAGAALYAATTPLPQVQVRDERGRRHLRTVPSEVGGVTVFASREAPTAVFAALHEPFEKGKRPGTRFERIGQTDEALAVAIVGARGGGINDRAMLRLAGDASKPLTLSGGGQSFTFADHVWLRVGAERVTAWGDLRAMTLHAAGRPKLILNGHEQRAQIADGKLTYRATR